MVSALSEQTPTTVLHSAFRAPEQSRHWSRKPPLVKFAFTHTQAICRPDGNVVLTAVDDGCEEIEIAGNWMEAEKLNESNPARYATESGYIGAGFTKRGIYVYHLSIHIEQECETDCTSNRHDLMAMNMF